MAKFVPLSEAEKNNETSLFAAIGAGIQMKKNIYHFSTGHEDFKDNFTMLNIYKEPDNFVAYPS